MVILLGGVRNGFGGSLCLRWYHRADSGLRGVVRDPPRLSSGSLAVDCASGLRAGNDAEVVA